MGNGFFSSLGGEIAIAVVVAPIGYWLGRRGSKADGELANIARHKDKLTNDIRSLSDDAQNIFTSAIDTRERIGTTAIITTTLRRISQDLEDLCRCLHISDQYFLSEYTNLYNSITEDPFGDEGITPFDRKDPRISRIIDSEAALIRRIRSSSS